MLDRDVVEKPVVQCGCCRLAAEHEVWDTPLCAGCYGLWHKHPPDFDAAELAHADAHPADVELRGVHQTLRTGQTEARWVLLKREVAIAVARNTAAAWLLKHRKPALTVVPGGAT